MDHITIRFKNGKVFFPSLVNGFVKFDSHPNEIFELMLYSKLYSHVLSKEKVL